MKKLLIIFFSLVFLLVVAKTAYNKYCQSKPNGCKEVEYDENRGLPEEGVDW